MRVFSNSAMSLDGKLATFMHDHVMLGTAEDRRMMGVLRAQADGLLVGGATFRNWPYPCVDEDRSPARPMVNAVLTRLGRIRREGPFYQDPRILPVILGGSAADLGGFEPSVHVHRCTGEPDVRWALDLLAREYGLQNLLVEAGGDLLFQILAADALDELYVTLCPRILGGVAATTLVDGMGFTADQMRQLDLVSMKRVVDEIFLHYRVRRGA